jgi:hypothetical protein
MDRKTGQQSRKKKIPAGKRAKIAPQGKAVKRIVVRKAKEISPQQVIPLNHADFQVCEEAKGKSLLPLAS